MLIVANYDRLANERLQRVAALEKGKNGDITVVDTGKYEPHGYVGASAHYACARTGWRAPSVPGGTFAQMAYALLTQKRCSYVEFEMLPEGSDKRYSNAGLLNTAAWRGKRCRRYYLAPGGHRHCVRETAEGLRVSGSAFLGSVHDSLLTAPRGQAKPMCLALEIVDAPLSKLRLAADEPVERMQWQAQIRGVTVSAWTTIRADRIKVMNESRELYRYFGFDHPNELEPRYRCHSAAEPRSDVSGTSVSIMRAPFL